MDLYDLRGHRKYLTASEWRTFLDAAGKASPPVATFCETLAFSGCRISEALNLTVLRVDLEDGLLVFESLKKRRRGVFRAVPVPPSLLIRLDEVHGLRRARAAHPPLDQRLWKWCRATAWKRVSEVMDSAGITGMHATPKGLRHGFGIRAVSTGVPLNLTQRWLGHAAISTTAIYCNAIGPEEREIAKRMWA